MKSSFYDDKKFRKHLDNESDTNPNADFFGALSFCLLQSVNVQGPGGVRVYPNCSPKMTRCKHSTCLHNYEDHLLKPFNSLFVPKDLFHESIYPTIGTQFNIILFVKSKHEGSNERKKRTRSQRKAHPMKHFNKIEFFEEFEEKTKSTFGSRYIIQRQHRLICPEKAFN